MFFTHVLEMLFHMILRKMFVYNIYIFEELYIIQTKSHLDAVTVLIKSF